MVSRTRDMNLADLFGEYAKYGLRTLSDPEI